MITSAILSAFIFSFSLSSSLSYLKSGVGNPQHAATISVAHGLPATLKNWHVSKRLPIPVLNANKNGEKRLDASLSRITEMYF